MLCGLLLKDDGMKAAHKKRIRAELLRCCRTDTAGPRANSPVDEVAYLMYIGISETRGRRCGHQPKPSPLE